MSKPKPFEPVAVGPRGGALDQYNPHWRTQEFQPTITSNGEKGLHRFVKDHDTATQGFKNEQPWHRMAAYMLNAGRTNSEIAMAADVSVIQVSQLRSQRWFQELCATIANENGEEILGAIKSHVLDAVQTVAEIMNDTDAPASVRHNAAKTLIEQGAGKPIQRIISSVSHSSTDPKSEYDEIMKELEALRPKPS